MIKPKILIVDNETSILFTLKNCFRNYDVATFSIPSKALETVKAGALYDILLIDFRMPEMSGRDFLLEIKKYLTSYKAILITAYSDKDLLEYGINNELFQRILNKPIDFDKLIHLVKELMNTLEKERSDKDYQAIINKQITSLVNAYGPNKSVIIHASTIMQNVIATARKYAASNTNVCLEGDSGTGKEVFANLIHTESSRAGKPFIKINCSCITDTLFESEMFGSKKGAFTGADNDKTGRFQQANGGTLFLDEVAELPLNQQAKFLRVLEDTDISSVGSIKNDKIDVRIICATNKDLDELVEKNMFRLDLRYRLKILSLRIPSLKERITDIPLLSSYFLNDIANKEGGSIKTFDRDALEYLSTINYQGNIRELKNLVIKLYVLTDSNIIGTNHIQNILDDNKNRKPQIKNFLLAQSFTLEEIEREYILAQLEKNDYVVNETSKVLGIEASNLSRKLKLMGVSVKELKK